MSSSSSSSDSSESSDEYVVEVGNQNEVKSLLLAEDSSEEDNNIIYDPVLLKTDKIKDEAQNQQAVIDICPNTFGGEIEEEWDWKNEVFSEEEQPITNFSFTENAFGRIEGDDDNGVKESGYQVFNNHFDSNEENQSHSSQEDCVDQMIAMHLNDDNNK
ncbi:Uncharacterized protein QTN25_006611 [Entamoeba marina]